MSDETRMNHEHQLPVDLVQLESSLARIALPDSKLDRDELMYQSGWAAAIANRNLVDSQSPIKRTTTIGWGWPAAAMVATAASVLFCGLFVWQTMNDSVLNVAQSGGKISNSIAGAPDGSLGAADSGSQPVQLAQAKTNGGRGDLLDLVMEYPSNRKMATGFVLFDSSLDLPADEVAPSFSSPQVPLATPKNQFELMQELLGTPASQFRSPYL